MREQEFVDAVNAIVLDRAAEDEMIRSCRQNRQVHRLRRRRVWAAAAACTAAAVLLAAPMLGRSGEERREEARWLDALCIQAQAKGLEAQGLERGVVTRLPFGSCFYYVVEEQNGREAEVIGGALAPDFQVSGEDVRSVTYTAENGELFCEFDSAFHDEEGNFLWSDAFVPVPQEYAGYLQDWRNPTAAELVHILEALHAAGELEPFYQMYYNREFAETDGKRGWALAEAYGAYREMCRQPIDFNRFTLTAEIDPAGRYPLGIHIVNPEYPPVAPVQAKTVTASGGDTVSWLILDAVSGKTRDEVDFAQIWDNIHVSVTYGDGTVRECTIALQFSPQGELSVELQT